MEISILQLRYILEKLQSTCPTNVTLQSECEEIIRKEINERRNEASNLLVEAKAARNILNAVELASIMRESEETYPMNHVKYRHE